MADKEKLVEIVLGMVEDVNPAEIASHIARGDLHEWCRQWRETVGKYLADVGNSVTVHKTGRWIDKPTGRYRQMQLWCSACGQNSGIGGIEINRHKPFCPNCGVKMEVTT